MQRHGGDVDLGDVIDADRPGGADHGNAARIIGKAAAIEHMVGGESHDPAAGALDPDPALDLERMPLDAALKLLVAVMGEADRVAGPEQRRQCHIKWKW